MTEIDQRLVHCLVPGQHIRVFHSLTHDVSVLILDHNDLLRFGHFANHEKPQTGENLYKAHTSLTLSTRATQSRDTRAFALQAPGTAFPENTRVLLQQQSTAERNAKNSAVTLMTGPDVRKTYVVCACQPFRQPQGPCLGSPQALRTWENKPLRHGNIVRKPTRSKRTIGTSTNVCQPISLFTARNQTKETHLMVQLPPVRCSSWVYEGQGRLSACLHTRVHLRDKKVPVVQADLEHLHTAQPPYVHCHSAPKLHTAGSNCKRNRSHACMTDHS
jgi:hypothetical protein